MLPHDPETSLLPYLATFVQAAELSNFTATARATGLSQASISQRIQALEKAVGHSLFARQSGRVVLTEQGRQLYDAALHIIDLHRTARQAVTGAVVPESGELLLAASSVPGEHLLPEMLSLFRPQHPLIQVKAIITDSQAVFDQLDQGVVHLGLVGRKDDQPHWDYCFLAHDHLVLIVPPGHTLAAKCPLKLADLLKYPLVVREPGSGVRHCLEKSLEVAGIALHRCCIAVELGSNEAVKEAVLRGLGVAVVSRAVVVKELADCRLLAVEIQDLLCDRELFLVRDRRRILPRTGRRFWSFAEATLANVHKRP